MRWCTYTGVYVTFVQVNWLRACNYHYGANWPSFHGLTVFFVVDWFVCLFVCLCSSSDLSVPITELVRMVKLYSTPWETKSAALKKLHEDYEKWATSYTLYCTILVPRAYDPSGLAGLWQESRALRATISGMCHRCRLRSETGWAEFSYFLCYFRMVALRALDSCRRPEGS